MRKFIRLAQVLSLALAALSVAHAQIDQGSITGIVRDPSHALVPDATVTLLNPDTDFTQVTHTDASGIYVFSPVKVGKYTISVTAAGFETVRRENAELQIAQRLDVDFTLQLGAVSQTVQVNTTDLPLLQTEEASTGQVYNRSVINDTPLNGRNYVYIAQLTAGVQEGNNYYTGNKGGFVANGTRGEQTDFVLDGVDNNSGSPDLLNGANYSVKPPPDALQEFKVQTSNSSAEFGHSAGAVVNATIRSGTNQFHGGLWEYFRDDVLNAQDRFAASKPEYRQNQFGGMLGGPLLRDKLFIFGDYEGNRIVYGTPQTVGVPTLKMRVGDFSELLNPALTGGSQKTLYVPGSAGSQPLSCNGVQNVFCPSQLSTPGSSLALKLLNLLPEPNTGVAGQTYSNYSAVVKDTDNTNQFDIRTDWNATAKDQAFVRLSWSQEPRDLPSILGDIGSNDFLTGIETNDSKGLVASETHEFNQSTANELRFGYNWLHIQRTQFNSTSDLSKSLGLGGVPYGDISNNGGTPAFNVGGIGPYGSFGSSQYQPSIEYATTYQLLDNLSRVWGQHAVKIGISYTNYRQSLLQPPQSRGVYNYSGAFTQDPNNAGATGSPIADFVADYQDNAALSNPSNIENGRPAYAGYAQDDWKVSPRLTLNLGLRYEYNAAPEERHDHQATFVVNADRTSATYLLTNSQRNAAIPAGIVSSVFVPDRINVAYTGNRKLVSDETTNFAPRLGVNFRVADKAVIRGGYGIFYGGYEPIGGYYNTGFNAPFAFDAAFFRPGCAPPPGTCNSDGISLAAGFQSALAVGLANYVTTSTLRSYANFRSPRIQEWNVAAQYAITRDLSTTVAYVGNHGTNNPVAIDGNQIGHLLTVAQSEIDNPLGTNYYRPFPDVGFNPAIVYQGYSNYAGMNATVEQRSRHGVTFFANYTLSHALEAGQSPLGDILNGAQGPRNPFQLGYGYDYGSSSLDVRHRFTFNGQLESPFGKNKRFLNSSNVADTVLGGWLLSLVMRVQSGNLSPVYATNNPTNGAGGATAYRASDPSKSGGSPDESAGQTQAMCDAPTHTLTNWFNPCAFHNPLPAASDTDIQAYGPAGTTFIRGPGYVREDMSLLKNIPSTREGLRLQFRADIFNLTNTPAYFQPSTYIGGATNITSSRFSGIQPDARVAQFALKMLF